MIITIHFISEPKTEPNRNVLTECNRKPTIVCVVPIVTLASLVRFLLSFFNVIGSVSP